MCSVYPVPKRLMGGGGDLLYFQGLRTRDLNPFLNTADSRRIHDRIEGHIRSSFETSP